MINDQIVINLATNGAMIRYFGDDGWVTCIATMVC